MYVCQVVPLAMLPQFQVQIEGYNEHLFEWGKSNGVKVIKTPAHFRLSTGELDDMCFEGVDSNPVLNRLGVIRLLGTIEAQCPKFKLCNNWNIIKKAPRLEYSYSTNTSSQPSPPRQLPPQPDPYTSRHPPPNKPTTGAAPRPPLGLVPRGAFPPRHPSSSEQHTAASRPRTDTSWAHVTRRGYHPPGQDSASPATTFTWRHTGDQSQLSSRHTYHHTAPKYGCFNCGEFNHRQASCRFDHRLRCGHCRQLGHKGKLCQYPNA